MSIDPGVSSLEVYKDENILLDAKFLSVLVYNGDQEKLCVKIRLECPRKQNKFIFHFLEVKEFLFYLDDLYALSAIERYKFLRTSDHYYYISFDPFDEYSEAPCDKDGRLIICKHIKRFIESDLIEEE